MKKKSTKVYDELLGFFRNDDCSWDKDEILFDYATEALEENGFEKCFIDECIVASGDQTCGADEFILVLYEKIMQGVCNTIESFRDEQDGGAE